MTSIAIPFNILGFFGSLKDAGIPEKQAKVHIEVLQQVFQAYEEKNRAELATKGDIRETELRLQKEIEVVRGEIKNTELRLQKEILQSKHEMIKWYIGMSIAQIGVIVASLYAIIK